jgi:homoserine dehydrogenase
LGEVVEETKRLGYAEPGTANPVEVINKEAVGDVPMKAAILFNLFNLSEERIRAIDIRTHLIQDSELKTLEREAQERRYIVSITKNGNGEENVIWGFNHQVGDWHISAGFKHIRDNPLFRKLIPSGVDNALLISEGDFGRDGSYVVSGPGAGPGPTANSMIIDAETLIKR